MKKRLKQASKLPWIALWVVAAFLFFGCGDNETAKQVADAAKKRAEGEIAKTKEGIKKQIDQVLKPGAGNEQKENGEDESKAEKEDSGKESHKKLSKKEDD